MVGVGIVVVVDELVVVVGAVDDVELVVLVLVLVEGNDELVEVSELGWVVEGAGAGLAPVHAAMSTQTTSSRFIEGRVWHQEGGSGAILTTPKRASSRRWSVGNSMVILAAYHHPNCFDRDIAPVVQPMRPGGVESD